MIDTHSHILPGIDDGSKDLFQSIEFLKEAESQGVHTIIATPHSFDGVFNCDKETILNNCNSLSKQAMDLGLRIQVLPGAEVRLNHDIIAEFDRGNLLTLNNSGTYLLVELPNMFMASAISMVIKQLRDRGVTVIIAHAERNPMILNTPKLVSEFVFNGARIQITASSLVGDFGRSSKKAAEAMLSMDHVFCVGSDIHPGRKYRMEKARNRLIKLVGKRDTELITRENALDFTEATHLSCKKYYR